MRQILSVLQRRWWLCSLLLCVACGQDTTPPPGAKAQLPLPTAAPTVIDSDAHRIAYDIRVLSADAWRDALADEVVVAVEYHDTSGALAYDAIPVSQYADGLATRQVTLFPEDRAFVSLEASGAQLECVIRSGTEILAQQRSANRVECVALLR